MTNAVSDTGGSGPASSAFPNINNVNGMDHNPQTVTTPAGGPYTSTNAYSWTSGATFVGTTTITSADVAGNTGGTTLTFALDNTAPTGGALNVNGSAASTGGTTSADSDGSFAIGTRTDYTDSGSGIASSTLVRTQATLSNNTCGTFGSPVTITGTPIQDAGAGISSGNCYRYTLTGTDNVGNAAASILTTVKVDSVAPVTTITLSPTTPNGSAGWYKATAPTFTLTATDSASGVATRFYQIDGGTTQTYTVAVSIPNGQHTISYWSQDNAGNVESTNTTATIKVDIVNPANALTLTTKSGGGSFLSGSTVFYQGSAAGSFKIQNAVTDADSGAASSTFAALGGTPTGWTHTTPDAQTTPAGGPYASNVFSWLNATSSSPTEVVTGADAAGNTTNAPTLTFTNDSTAPTGGAVSVNGTAASPGGSTSATTSTSFAIDSRTNFTDAGSGLASSVLTVQSETYNGSTCGTPGSGGPYTSPTTISGTTNPAITAGFCYLYTLTGVDNVGNTASIKTTVTVGLNYTFVVSNPGTRTAGTSFGGFTIQLQLNGGNTTAYYGAAYSGAKTITFSGPSTSPSGGVPTYPATVTFTNGLATLPVGSVTLKAAESTTLTVDDATASPTIAGTSTSFTVSAGAAARLAWTSVTVAAGTLSTPCLFTCTGTGLGNSTDFVARVSVTDSLGNTVSALGAGHTVTVTTPTSGGGSGGAFTSPTSGTSVTLTIGSTGLADSTATFTFRTQNGSWTSDTISTQTLAGTVYTSASATITKN
jgi:hypothetical protein